MIGVTDKQEAHSTGYIHRVVAVYVFDRAGRLYVQHHKKSGLLDHSVGGHVTKDESYPDAAVRETTEEISLTVRLQHINSFYSDETYTGSNYRHMMGLFECQAPANWYFVPNNEVETIEPLALESIVGKMNQTPDKFTPGFLNSMESYLKATNSKLSLDLDYYRSAFNKVRT